MYLCSVLWKYGLPKSFDNLYTPCIISALQCGAAQSVHKPSPRTSKYLLPFRHTADRTTPHLFALPFRQQSILHFTKFAPSQPLVFLELLFHFLPLSPYYCVAESWNYRNVSSVISHISKIFKYIFPYNTETRDKNWVYLKIFIAFLKGSKMYCYQKEEPFNVVCLSHSSDRTAQ